MKKSSRRKVLAKRNKASQTALQKFRYLQKKDSTSISHTIVFLLMLFLPLAILFYIIFSSRPTNMPLIHEAVFNIGFGSAGVILYSLVLYFLRYRWFPNYQNWRGFYLAIFLGFMISLIIGPLTVFKINIDHSLDHQYGLQKIQRLYTAHPRRDRNHITYHVEFIVDGNDIDVIIPKEMYDKIHEGGCIDACIHTGKLGFRYVDKVELPSIIRHRITCPIM